MADDIGWFDVERLQSRDDGRTDAEHRPHRHGRRAVHRHVRRAKLHRRARGLHHRADPDAYRPDHGRYARREAGTSRRRPERRRPAEAARLRDRPDPARTISATATSICRPCTASTNFSATSIISTPRKSPNRTTIRRTREFQANCSGRVACSNARRPTRTIATVRPAFRPRRQADDRGHRSARQKADETVEDDLLARSMDFIDRANKSGQAVPALAQHHPHARLDASVRAAGAGKTGSASTATAWRSSTDVVGQLLKKLDDLGIADNTHRHLHHRQRRGNIHLAGRRHHAVPRREGSRLGRRLSRPVRDPLAGHDQAWHGSSTTSSRITTCCRPSAAAGVPDIVEKCKAGYTAGDKTLQGSPRRLQSAALTSLAR